MSSSLYNQSVLSVRDGHPIAKAIEPIIDPNNLKIVGWWCEGAGGRTVLLAEDIREKMPQGLVVNETSALTHPEDLVRHQEILKINFTLKDKPVKTKRQKLGRVRDYCYNEGLFVQKLYIERSLLKVLGSDTLIIDRQQIIEITDKFILVNDSDVKETETELEEAPAIEAAPAS